MVAIGSIGLKDKGAGPFVGDILLGCSRMYSGDAVYTRLYFVYYQSFGAFQDRGLAGFILGSRAARNLYVIKYTELVMP